MTQHVFEADGRTYTCEVATSPATPDTEWWWVSVSGDPLRFAAFHKQKGDTAATLKPRVVAFYEKVLADRARPPLPRQTWGRPPAPKTNGKPPA